MLERMWSLKDKYREEAEEEARKLEREAKKKKPAKVGQIKKVKGKK